MVSAVSMLGFLGSVHWTLDLCSHFRIQYLAALILGSGLLVLLRAWKSSVVFLLFAGLNLLPLLPLFIGAHQEAVEGPVRRLMTRLRVVATHPTPPTSREYARWRDLQLEQLPAFVAFPGPRILVGDLNVTPWNRGFRRFLKQSGLRDSSRGMGYQGTWPSDNPLLRIPLDHLLHSPEVRILDRRVGREVNSDHFPVVIDFMLVPGGGN